MELRVIEGGGASTEAGYTVREVAGMVGLPARQVREFVREGFLAPNHGARGEYRFSFRDLVLLRTTRDLVAANIPPARVKRALQRLREQLPPGKPLSGVTIHAEADEIVVRDGVARWTPESGQTLFDFEVDDLARAAAQPIAPAPSSAEPSGEDWFELGLDLEIEEPERAREAYAKALALNPNLADAHINLGRLLHEAGNPAGAEAHYRLALAIRPKDATASFNLGTAFEDMGRPGDAIRAYSDAIAADPDYADAYFNLAGLCERAGRKLEAFRLLRRYRDLSVS